MRIRSVKPSFFLHLGLFKLEKQTGFPMRIAFSGLWCAADREGRFIWEPLQLKVQILPYDNLDFSLVLDALKLGGFVIQYGEDQQYGWIPTFLRHQCPNNKELASLIPECPVSVTRDNLEKGTQVTRDNLEKGTQVTRDNLEKATLDLEKATRARACAVPFPSLPVPEEGGGGKPKFPVEEVRSRVNVLLKRKPMAAWSYEEETALVDIAKRDDVLSEVAEMEAFFQKGDYLPQKVSSLLSGWPGHLDRARRDPTGANGKPEESLLEKIDRQDLARIKLKYGGSK